MNEFLKECPFCGSTDCKVTVMGEAKSENKHFFVYCHCGKFQDCNATSREAAVENWNKRYNGNNISAGVVYEYLKEILDVIENFDINRQKLEMWDEMKCILSTAYGKFLEYKILTNNEPIEQGLFLKNLIDILDRARKVGGE